MQYSRLGSSGLEVSRVCLGTMTWGTQNNQADADQQINYALEYGINFIDTAEMYSIPPTAESYGGTEKIIGNWLNRHKEKRQDIVLASKIAGIGLPWVRNGGPITGDAVIEAVDQSLKRLQTDYIDVFQLHWTNRPHPHFGRHAINFLDFSEASSKEEIDGMLDILRGFDHCIKAGKVRYAGLSDDTPWGISQFIKLAEQNNLPRITSIQNEFNLLHSKDWPYLIEHCVMEDIAFLPWSPLAGGMLTGKYLNGQIPEGSRRSFTQRNGIFRDTEQCQQAVTEYQKLAKEFDITTAQLSLYWCDRVNGVTSTIIGATSMEQLKEDIDAFSIPTNTGLLEAIDKIYKQYAAPF